MTYRTSRYSEPDRARLWVRKVAPDDDYLPTPEPPPRDAPVPPPRSEREAGERKALLESLLEDSVAMRLTARPAPVRRKTVQDRNGDRWAYATTLTKKQYDALEEARLSALERAATVLQAVESKPAPVERCPRDPTAKVYHLHEGNPQPELPTPAQAREDEETLPEWWSIWDPEDAYDDLADLVEAPSDAADDAARERALGLEPGTLTVWRAEDEARRLERVGEVQAGLITQAWTHEIAEHRARGDPRFAPDPRCSCPTRCEWHPEGCCVNPPKGKTGLCPACGEWRRTHKGQHRPSKVIHRDRRRKGLGL